MISIQSIRKLWSASIYIFFFSITTAVEKEMFPRFAISMEMTPKAFFKFWFVFYAHKLFLFSRLLFDIYLSTIGGFRTNHHQNILCSKFISQMTRFKIRTVHQELIAFFDRLDRKFCEFPLSTEHLSNKSLTHVATVVCHVLVNSVVTTPQILYYSFWRCCGSWPKKVI